MSADAKIMTDYAIATECLSRKTKWAKEISFIFA